MEKRIELTQQTAVQLAGALSDLQALSERKILTAEDEAKKRGLTQFLQNNAVLYLNEFVASWFAVHLEYEPLIQGCAALLSRANGVLVRNAQARAAQEAAPDNIVPLGGDEAK